ncbi:MAG: hypothetical protein ACRCZP_07300, partial [Phycicoccus sp.]
MGLAQWFTRARPGVPGDLAEHGRAIDVRLIDGVRYGLGQGAVPDPASVGVGSAYYGGGMRIPGAWRAALLLSDLLGSIPWHAYRRFAGRPIERQDPTPPLLEQPYPPEPLVTTMSSWALDLMWRGGAFGVISARNAEGTPTAVNPVPLTQVWARRQDGRIL